MHKKLLLILVFFSGLFISKSNAQSISVGPRLGLNFSKLAYSEGDANQRYALENDQESLTGAQIGAVVNIGISEMLSIQPELLFSQKGRRHEGYYWPVGNYESKYRRDYLEIPILIKATFGTENLNFFVNGGPYLAYLTGGKNNFLAGGNETEHDLELKYRHGSKPNRSDVGLALGGGIGSQIGPGNLALDVRYSFGFSDLNQFQNNKPGHVPKYANRTLGVSLSYLVPLN